MKSSSAGRSLFVLLSVLILSIRSAPFVLAIERKQTKDINSEAWSNCSLICQPSKYDEFFSGPDGQERLEKAKQISGILEELDAHRQNFMRTGDFVDLFPSVYYQITKIELDAIMSGQMTNPTQKMDMMMRFYDAYDYNRQAFDRQGSSAVESHWQEYYTQAETTNKLLTNWVIGCFPASRRQVDGIRSRIVLDQDDRERRPLVSGSQ